VVFHEAQIRGPRLTAIVFDTTRSYQIAFAIFIACFLASAVFLYFAQPPVPVVSTPSLEASDY